MALRYALVRYRADLVQQELLPDLACWFGHRCYITAAPTMEVLRPIHWRDMQRAEGFKTRYGWEPQAWEGRTSGRFLGRARFDRVMPVDCDNLVGLIREVRARGIIPLLLVMPVHETFRAAHEPGLSRILREVAEIAAAERVPLLQPRSDYRDANLFVDGHHMSRLGAGRLSADVGSLLAPYLGLSRGSPRSAFRAAQLRMSP